MSSPNVYPLIFTFREPIAGRSFVAGVAISGRILARREDDGEWWFYGVDPGAMAEGGTSLPEAYAKFTGALRDVLSDAAVTASTFDEFKNFVDRFVAQVDELEAATWTSALEAFRSGLEVPEAPFKDLRRQPTDATNFGALVARLDREGTFLAQGENPYSTQSELLRPAA